MIPILIYKDYCEELKVLINADKLKMVVLEEHLSKKLKNENGRILSCVYPSASDESSDEDSPADRNTVIISVLENLSELKISEDLEINLFSRTGKAIDTLKNKIREDKRNSKGIMKQLDVASIEIEPEYNVAGGWKGYSMAFSFISE